MGKKRFINESKLKNYSKAIEFSLKNKEKEKTLSYYYQDRGFSYRNMKKYKKAISDFKEAIKLNSDLDSKLSKEISKLEQYEK